MLARRAADAQATIAALQARVKELEALRPLYDDMWKQFAESQAELERVRGELDHAKKMEAIQKEVADNQTWHVQKLRALTAALPKVEGDFDVIARYRNENGSVHLNDEVKALLRHRQGMEG